MAFVSGRCLVDITYNNQTYSDVYLGVMKDLCCDILLGIDFQRQHKRVVFEYDGMKEDMVIPHTSELCADATASVEIPSLFKTLPGCRPIAVESRRYNADDRAFIKEEIARFHSEGIIQLSVSPWRTQVVVLKGEENIKNDLLSTIHRL